MYTKSKIIYCCILNIFFLFDLTAKAEPNLIQDTKKTELQVKLDELNSSLAQLNNQTEEVKKKDDLNKIEHDVSPSKKVDTPSFDEKNKKNDKEQDKKVKQTKDDYSQEKKLTDWIINVIDNGTNRDRKTAISQILTIKDQGLKNELGKKLIDLIKNEADSEVRIKAITVAGEIKLEAAVPNLENCLNNEPEDVTVAAVYAIKRIGNHSPKPALVTKLKEQKLENNSTLIEALIDTLGEFKAAELSGIASEALKATGTNQAVREMLVISLGKIGIRESKDILLEIARDDDETEQLRGFAVNSLANLKIKEATADIQKITETIESYPFNKKKKYYNLYIYCISALVKLGDEKALPKFMNALRSDSAVVRLKAINLIKEVKDKRTIDILKYKMNYDPSSKVQAAARDALKEMGVDVEALKKETKAGSDITSKTKSNEDNKSNKEDE